MGAVFRKHLGEELEEALTTRKQLWKAVLGAKFHEHLDSGASGKPHRQGSYLLTPSQIRLSRDGERGVHYRDREPHMNTA